MALPNVLRDQWFNQQVTTANTVQPFVVNTGNVYYGTTSGMGSPSPTVERDATPMEWLREQVDEMCALGRAA